MNTKYVVIVQCDIAHRRCSGFACTDAFYNRDEMFKTYDDDVEYISFTCGGCCGKGVASKFEHFSKKLRKAKEITKDEVAVHLASCMVTDNHHYDRCPTIDYIKGTITKKGYNNIIEKTYVSRNATQKRNEGIYNTYE